jgi:hypothetical protein
MEILPGTRDLSLNSEWKTGVGAAGYSLHIRVRTFTAFGDEAVDPRGDNGQRYRAELEHGIVESADVEFETRSLPNLLVAYPRDFTFYVADPLSSIRARSFALPSFQRSPIMHHKRLTMQDEIPRSNSQRTPR